MDVMQVKKLSEFAVIPSRGSRFAAGFDLSSAHDYTVPSKGRQLVKTDIAVSIPENTYARIAPRSGLALKHGIDVGAGVVDYDYRGNVGVILFNFGDADFEVKRGDRVAQLILEKISMVDAVESDVLFETERGASGFGSTGVSKDTVDTNNSKRIKLDTEAIANMSESLSVFDSLSESLGDERVKKCKTLVLASDIRIFAALNTYKSTKQLDKLIETVDLL